MPSRDADVRVLHVDAAVNAIDSNIETGSSRLLAVALTWYLLAIINSQRTRQVAFGSLAEGMDTTTAWGELLFHVFGALLQYERALIRERVIAALDAVKRGADV